MANRTFEADRYGRISIYPSLDARGEMGLIRRIFRRILRLIFGRMV